MNQASAFIEKLTSQGYAPAIFSASHGGKLVILPFGALVIGAFCPPCPENILWTGNEIFDRTKFLAKPGWKNLGGERTWISPERELFIQDLNNIATTYVVPAAFDPGQYQVTHTDTQKIRLVNQAQVRSYVTGESADVQIEKEIELLDSANPSELDYRQTVTLKLLSPTKTLKLGLWNVTQLPAGGSILIGTHKPASYTTYFGQDTQNRVKVSDRCITFCISARESHKIGVKVDAITSKIGYIRPVTADLYAFYLRTITVDPNGDYVDTPWNNPADTGHVIQCYNDDGQFGNFGELEYHSPAIGAATGKSEYRDVSRIQIFTGPKSALRDLCAQQMDIPAASLPI